MGGGRVERWEQEREREERREGMLGRGRQGMGGRERKGVLGERNGGKVFWEEGREERHRERREDEGMGSNICQFSFSCATAVRERKREDVCS